jgi:hypothetical protein
MFLCLDSVAVCRCVSSSYNMHSIGSCCVPRVLYKCNVDIAANTGCVVWDRLREHMSIRKFLHANESDATVRRFCAAHNGLWPHSCVRLGTRLSRMLSG